MVEVVCCTEVACSVVLGFVDVEFEFASLLVLIGAKGIDCASTCVAGCCACAAGDLVAVMVLADGEYASCC